MKNRITICLKILWTICAIQFGAPLFSIANPVLPIAANSVAPTVEEQPDQTSTPIPVTIPDIEKRIEYLSGLILTDDSPEAKATAESNGIEPKEHQNYILKIISLKSNYELLRSELKKKESYQKDEETLKDKLDIRKNKGLTPPPPYSLSIYDALLDEKLGIDNQKEGAHLALGAAKRTISETESQLKAVAKKWRIFLDENNIQPDQEAPTTEPYRISWKRNLLETEKEMYEVRVIYEKTNQENLEKELSLIDMQNDLLSRQAEWVRQHLKYDEMDLKQQFSALESKKKQLNKLLKDEIRKQQKAEKTWLISFKASAGEMAGEEDAVSAAAFKTQDTLRKTHQAEIEMMEDMLRLIEQQKQLWQSRYDLVKGSSAARSLKTMQAETEAVVIQLGSIVHLQQNYQTTLQFHITTVKNKISENPPSPRILTYLNDQLDALRQQSEIRTAYIALLMTTWQMNQRYLNEISMLRNNISIKEHLAQFWDYLRQIWQFEIWVIDNRPLTVSKITIAIIIFILGLMSVQHIVRILDVRLARMTHLPASRLSVIRKLVSYFSYLMIILLVLRIVNIPLGAFAFLGGAIAIGVGFGAQNLINNFISGFIIMGERPINIGDVIDVDGALGKVEEIGARCTRIRTGENIDILVPNSCFLEKNITNWTLNDQKIRTNVTIGVAYGSPARKVEDLLLESVRVNDRIMKRPEPFVIFNDFGDNALIFKVFFWITIGRVIERQQIESSVRFEIEALFRDAGIEIAFPQRDIHLDTHRPLEVRLVEPKEENTI